MGKRDIYCSFILGFVIALFLYTTSYTLRFDIPSEFNFIIRKPYLVLLCPILFPALTFISHYMLVRWTSAVQFSRFMVVGISNLCIDFGFLNIFMYVSDIDRGIAFSVFKAASFSLAIFNSYLWNKFWTFGDRQTDYMASQFAKFAAVAVGGLVINVITATIIVNYVTPDFISTRIWANIAAMISLAAVSLWNFMGYKFFVFRNNEPSG